MQVAFYGTVRQIGTSANMAAVRAGLRCYFEQDERPWAKEITFFECGRHYAIRAAGKDCSLLVLNLSIPYQELETIYYMHSCVQKNVIFLIGKYYQTQSEELEKLAGRYRIDRSRICAIPYNPGFQKAYDEQRVLSFLKGRSGFVRSRKDAGFEQHLKHTVNTIITYAGKGEKIYG